MAAETLAVQVYGMAGDEDRLELLTDRLRQELLELDVERVDPVDESDPPEQAKGLALLAGALIVKLGKIAELRSVLVAIGHWAARNRRDVEVSLGGDVLKVTGLTSTEQERIIDAWLARHTPGT